MENTITQLKSIGIKAMESLLETMPANVYAKDKNGLYLCVNNMFSKVCGYPSTSDIVGKTDLDLQWNREAETLISNDQAVIKNADVLTTIEWAKVFNGSIKKFLSHKIPLRNSLNKIIGVFGVSFMLDDMNSQSFSKAHEKYVKALSPQQQKCLFYLANGMTIKQIAKTINISPKTVEHYIEAIKIKLNCHSRAELIAYALQIDEMK